MKRLFTKIYDTFKSFFLWVWRECRDWRTFVLLALVCIVIGTPVWGGYLLYILFKWKWAFAVATACLAFWWIPGVPFFAISVTVTLAIKKIVTSILGKKQRQLTEEQQEADGDAAPQDRVPEASPETGSDMEHEETKTGK